MNSQMILLEKPPMLFRLVLTFITTGCLLLSISCGKDQGADEDIVTGQGARLKHITQGTEGHGLIESLMQDYSLSSESFTNVGSYPIPVYTYYYTLNWEWNQNSDQVTAHRVLSCSAGMGIDSKEEILKKAHGFIEIQDDRLGKPPYQNVFAIRYQDQKKEDWRYEIHILKVMNNMRNQNITLTGSYGPVQRDDIAALAPNPPDEKTVITELLKLLEPIQ
ncbi:hypothetical protein [Sphingobacterium pedocola]|uniref:DUF4136 domain-containing protein n=1 Tax=Sphingobacterium pedocola TaxID=2082722 RepID=A0ABR9TBJ2_9SPHI|nr:hypothetical protein [Sphingobacterium pedocola]MBE8722684.1 hypothetical protein [Sphingobacterium pedocola]